MSKQRRSYSAQFKFKIALEAVSGTKTISQLSSQYQVHSSQIGQWKRHLLDGGAQIFVHDTVRKKREQDTQETDLFEQIGRLKMELEWVKKKAAPFS